MMMKKFYLILTCVALCAYGGGNAKQPVSTTENITEEKQVSQYPIYIPFEEGMEIEREVKLSDIADSVEYIRLETTDDCLVKGFKLTNIIKTTKYYIIPEAQKVFQFTLDGKFVRNIGRRGQGPGEFLYVTHIDANEKSNLISIYCSSSQKMNFYNLETGKFIYSVRSPYQGTSITSMYNDSTFISHVRNINGQKEIKLYFSDRKGKMLKSFNRPEKFICPIAGASISGYSDNYIYRYENEVCYKEYENDTVYVATPNELKKKYILNLGKYSIPVEHTLPFVANVQKYHDVASGYIRTNVVETKKYLFFPYTHWAGKKMNEQQYLIYNKKTKECFHIKGDKIINDTNHGMDFSPIWALDKDMIDIFSAHNIYELAEKNPELLNHPQLKDLKEDDNPVLMIVHLKR